MRAVPLPAIRAELLGHFAEDDAALAVWLGRDLTVWQIWQTRNG